MSLLQSKTNQGQVLIHYSEERKGEMKPYKEESCIALASLLESRLKELGVRVDRLLQPTGKGRIADIIIEFTATSEEDIERLKETLKKIGNTSEGVGKVALFIKRK